MNAAVRQHANPVRSQPRLFRPGRVVQVRFTEFAQLAAKGGTLTMFGPTPDEVARDLVRRLGVAADLLEPRALQLGDVALLRCMPLDAPGALSPGRRMPVAFIAGLAKHEIEDSLAWLSQPATGA